MRVHKAAAELRVVALLAAGGRRGVLLGVTQLQVVEEGGGGLASHPQAF
jgi:hypothetical protein